MRNLGTGLVLALIVGSGTVGPLGAEDETPKGPQVAPHEPLDIGPAPLVTAAVVREVEELVLRLKGITHDHGGLTTWSGGGPYYEAPGGWMGAASESPDEADRAFVALVERGPTALPALLAHLDDATPTAMKIEGRGGFGGMWLGGELDANGADEEEVRRLLAVLRPPKPPDAQGNAPEERENTEPGISEHVVTLGDVCYAILGQVTNRAYQAVRYQPTGCVVVNSPTSQPRIAQAVRALWVGQDLRRELARRLMLDLHTVGAEGLQAGAVRRLLAYFPAAAEPLVARLLDQVETPEVPPPHLPDAQRLASEAAEAQLPGLRPAMLRLALRTESADVLRSALGGLPEDRSEALYLRVRRLLGRRAAEEHGSPDAEGLLQTLGARWPDRLPEALTWLLTSQGLVGARIVIGEVHGKVAPLPVSAWRPLLDVRDQATTWQSNPPAPLERLRVCDAAALQVVAVRTDLAFDAAADEAGRDTQLEVLRKAFDAPPPPAAPGAPR